MELAVIIQSKIYEIRGQRVMLDFDLADTHGIETKVLKQAVKRNIKRFEGEDFMFTLTKEELSRSQIVTLNKGRGSNFKYMPSAFTELGVAMLSSVLNSDTRMQLELINQTLAEMQTPKRQSDKPRNPIGFIKPE